MIDDPQREDASPIPPAPRRRRRWPWILLLVIVVLPALLFAAWTKIALSYNYSEAGHRAGYLQKLSHKGWICKTWEGELAMVNQPGGAEERFLFTVRSDSLANAMSKMMGSRVSITYEQHKGVPGSCFGDTEYYVIGADPAAK